MFLNPKYFAFTHSCFLHNFKKMERKLNLKTNVLAQLSLLINNRKARNYIRQ